MSYLHESIDEKQMESLRRRLDTPPASPRPGDWLVFETLTVFIAGVLLMNFLCGSTAGPAGSEIGVAGHDSFYHIKMAALLPEVGLVNEFPWLRFAYFTRSGHEFVSHHYGYHALLAPFVYLSKWLTGDYLAGGRWANCFFFGVVIALFHVLLTVGDVPYRWLWLTLFLLLPEQFFLRHTFVRAITPSLALLLLLLIFLICNRPLWAALIVAAYNHLYLGAVMYTPVVVALFVAAHILAPRDDRRIPWALASLTALGWIVGVVSYPYSKGMYEFLLLQVFGTGLTPDISVGTEWRPYQDVWWFAGSHSGVLLSVLAAAIVARFRFGPRAGVNETALLLINLAFLALTLKARRFIEYWPALCLISAAYLAAPPLRVFRDWLREKSAGWRSTLARGAVVATAIALSAGLIWLAARNGTTFRLTQHWQLIAIAGVLTLPWLARVWLEQPRAFWRRGIATLGVTLAALGAFSTTAALGAEHLLGARKDAQCQYTLKSVRDMMRFIQDHSQPGDVIFTDDWDIFPVFFYHNSFNHYIVGLDPKFTHEREPELWERYVRLSRGQAPITVDFKERDAVGVEQKRPLSVKMEDIRDRFEAKWVITDSDHGALAAKLFAAPYLAELVYPSKSFEEARQAPFQVFRVRDASESTAAESVKQYDLNGVLYLGYLAPLTVEQGWGELHVDRSVDGEPLRLAGVRHLHGLGTHAPSTLRYAVPEGYQWFEATVGVNSSQGSRGSVVISVLIDGEEVFTSDPLQGKSAPAVVNVPLTGAREIELRADPTDDGMACDHVDWASARFVREVEEAIEQTEPSPTTKNSAHD